MSEWREILADWQGGLVFTGRNPSGASIQMGSWEDRPGISPMEMLLLGLAGCTGMDVASILEKKRQPLSKLRIRVRGKRAEEHPKVYTEIEIQYLLWGEGLDPKAVERAIALSEEKYCSASAMLRAKAEVRSSYQINPVGEADEFTG